LKSTDELLAGVLDVCLVYHRIAQCRVDTGMSEQTLYLLNWHSFVDRHCRERAPKLMRMHILNIQFAANLPEPNLNSADLQPIKRFQQADKESFIVIRSLI